MRVERPGKVTFASIASLVFGALYLLMGLLFFFDGLNVIAALLFTSIGAAMTVGSFGLLAAKRWALRWARVGVGALFGLHAFICLIMFSALLFDLGSSAPPDGVIFAALMVFAMTVVQGAAFQVLRGQEAEDYLWQHTEQSIEQSPHERLAAGGHENTVLDFDDSASGELPEHASESAASGSL